MILNGTLISVAILVHSHAVAWSLVVLVDPVSKQRFGLFVRVEPITGRLVATHHAEDEFEGRLHPSPEAAVGSDNAHVAREPLGCLLLAERQRRRQHLLEQVIVRSHAVVVPFFESHHGHLVELLGPLRITTDQMQVGLRDRIHGPRLVGILEDARNEASVREQDVVLDLVEELSDSTGVTIQLVRRARHLHMTDAAADRLEQELVPCRRLREAGKSLSLA